MSLQLIPVTLAECKRFIADHHRHNIPPVGWKFGVGVSNGGGLVGVAVASRPVARGLDDGLTLEVTRTCTTGARNANSMLYGAIARASSALGYRKLITYTLAKEPGSSLRAVGFVVDAELPARRTWASASKARYDVTLFGEARRPVGPKLRWVRTL